MGVPNQRQVAEETATASRKKRRISILVEFPEERLESVIIQWETLPPTVLIQRKNDPAEPLQFPGKRPDIPGNSELPKDRPLAIDQPLRNFLDPTNGRPFGGFAYLADILISAGAFTLIQPEPDLFLPPQSLWDCRAEALRAMGIADEPGIPAPPAAH